MRFWIGKELEGRYRGINTLFVEADVITSGLIKNIKLIASKYSFGQIYFGAGEVDVTDINVSAEELDLLKNNYILTVETHQQRSFYKECFNHVVLSFYVENEQDVEYTFKIRTDKNVYCMPKKNCFVTNLKDLKDGLFSGTDVEIFPCCLGNDYEM